MVVRASMPSAENPQKERVCMLAHGDIVRVSYEPHPPKLIDGSWWIPIDQDKYVTSSGSTTNISNTISQMQLEAQQRKARAIRHPLMPH